MLDATALVAAGYSDLKEVSLFLVEPSSLPADAALALYVSIGGGGWSYRGAVTGTHPSDVFPLSWPAPQPGVPLAPGFAQIGVSIEPAAEVAQKEGSKIGAKEEFCRRVGLDLFNFMQSFGGVQGVGSDKLLVPTNVLDHWFARIERRLKADPDFLTRHKDAI